MKRSNEAKDATSVAGNPTSNVCCREKGNLEMPGGLMKEGKKPQRQSRVMITVSPHGEVVCCLLSCKRTGGKEEKNSFV